MNTKEVIILARKHLTFTDKNRESAEICLSDSISLFDKGDLEYAKKRAIKSLAYSIGICHPDYELALK